MSGAPTQDTVIRELLEEEELRLLIAETICEVAQERTSFTFADVQAAVTAQTQDPSVSRRLRGIWSHARRRRAIVGTPDPIRFEVGPNDAREWFLGASRRAVTLHAAASTHPEGGSV